MLGHCADAGGEVDVRGAYTALATAHMLKLDKAALAKQAGVVQYVRQCQVHPYTSLDQPLHINT